MSDQETKSDFKIHDFVVAKMGGRFLKFRSRDAVPESVDDGPFDLESITDMPKQAIGDLYGQLIGRNSKNFKTKEIAIESFVYQVDKLPEFDPSPAKQQSPTPTRRSEKASSTPPASGADKKGIKASTFELLTPSNYEEVLRKLAPQAREMVLMMIELAKEKGSMKFSSADLLAKINSGDAVSRLNTVQPPERILTYYKGTLITKGMIRET